MGDDYIQIWDRVSTFVYESLMNDHVPAGVVED